MIRCLLVISLVLGLVACSGNGHRQTSQSVPIRCVDDFAGKQCEWNRRFDMRVLDLRSDSLEYIGHVKDVAGIGASIYVLNDRMSSIAKFDSRTGLLEREISRRGNGPSEYIQPVALSADSIQLYLLDMGGRSILVYDKDLEAIGKIRLSFPALDFVKVSEGFLCYNLAVSDTLCQIVHIDEEGRVKSSFGPAEMKPERMYTGAKVFSVNQAGGVYCVLPFERTVYHWEESSRELCPFVTFDFGRKNLPEDADAEQTDVTSQSEYVVTSEFFYIDSLQVNSFLYANKRYYGFSTAGDSVCQAGMMVDNHEGKPFFPQWQMGNVLVSSYSYDEADESDEKGKYGNALLLFTLKGHK